MVEKGPVNTNPFTLEAFAFLGKKSFWEISNFWEITRFLSVAYNPVKIVHSGLAELRPNQGESIR
jgi:hypothetical protein